MSDCPDVPEVLDERKERMRNLYDQLPCLLMEFNFPAACIAMQKLDMVQYDPRTRLSEVPTVLELMEHAETLLKQVAATVGETAEIHSGGLSAYRVGDDYFRIAFEICGTSTTTITEAPKASV